jgi:hypothetical protein
VKGNEKVPEKPNTEADIEDANQLNRLGQFFPRTESPIPDEPRNVEVKRRARSKSDKL